MLMEKELIVLYLRYGFLVVIFANESSIKTVLDIQILL